MGDTALSHQCQQHGLGIKDLPEKRKGGQAITTLPSAPGSGRVRFAPVASSSWEPRVSSRWAGPPGQTRHTPLSSLSSRNKTQQPPQGCVPFTDPREEEGERALARNACSLPSVQPQMAAHGAHSVTLKEPRPEGPPHWYSRGLPA